MLHGVGDTGTSDSTGIYLIGFFMVPYAADLSRSLPNVRFVCPTGVFRLYSFMCSTNDQSHSSSRSEGSCLGGQLSSYKVYF